MITLEVQSKEVQSLLWRAIGRVGDPEPLLRAAGTTLLSITLGNFSVHGAAYRPIPWAPKADGTPATLKKSGTLSSAWRLEVSDRQATLSNPMPYAAIHQFGGQTAPHAILPRRRKALAFTSQRFGRVVVRKVEHPGSKIPARPFLPIHPTGQLTAMATLLVVEAMESALRRHLRA